MIAADLIRDGLVRLVDGRLQVRPGIDDATLTFIRTHRDVLVRRLAANDDNSGPTLADLTRALGPRFAIEADPVIRVLVNTADVLAHATEDDAVDLVKPHVLVAFAASLVADGLTASWTVRVGHELPVSFIPRQGPCCDCRHFQPDTVGFGQGIGQCAIDAPERRREPPSERYPAGHYGDEPALWPRAERFCSEFEQAAPATRAGPDRTEAQPLEGELLRDDDEVDPHDEACGATVRHGQMVKEAAP